MYLSIIEITILSPVQEHRELSEYSLESTPRVYSPELKHEEWEPKEIYTAQLSQMLEISKREINNLRDMQDENKRTLEKIVEENMKREENFMGQIKVLNESNSKIEVLNAKLQVENMKNLIDYQYAKSKITQMNEENERLKEMLKESENKRKDIQNALGNAHLKWQELKPNFTAVAVLEKENQGLLLTIKNLNEKIKEIEKNKIEDESTTNIISNLNSTVNQYKLEVQEIKKTNKALVDENTSLKDLIDKLRAGLVKQEAENSELSEQIKHPQVKPVFKDEKLDPIDKALKEYMRETGISNPFNKICEGTYQYANKKISLSLKNGVPVIRVGGGYMFIDEFLKIYNGQIKKKPDEELTERSQSLEGKIFKAQMEKFVDDIDVENFPELINTTPSASPLKKKSAGSTIVYPTKSAILKKIPRLNSQHRELTPNSRRNRTPRQVFLP